MVVMSYNFVLLRGLVREAAHWGQFIDEIKQQFSDSHFECIDIPGAGEFFQVATPLSIDGMVEFMRNQYRQRKLPANRPTVLVAVSLGGMISARWLKNHPEDFQYAILINTSYGDYSPMWKRLKPEALWQLLRVPALKGISKRKKNFRSGEQST
jgi:pimeloyl-[acyl-carrier protein] methyl ester esterase